VVCHRVQYFGAFVALMKVAEWLASLSQRFILWSAAGGDVRPYLPGAQAVG
jgi:hypothetical protein